MTEIDVQAVRADIDAMKAAIIALSQKLSPSSPTHPIIDGRPDVFKIVAELETAGWEHAKKVRAK